VHLSDCRALKRALQHCTGVVEPQGMGLGMQQFQRSQPVFVKEALKIDRHHLALEVAAQIGGGAARAIGLHARKQQRRGRVGNDRSMQVAGQYRPGDKTIFEIFGATRDADAATDLIG
jgi:hypothetical protein